ncbi:P-loop containing nucleoside triphosphate hydrolase protein, partial [Aureobasidium melanogenum]|uniref:p-loop containing nucleoside triphosphate hydrolase protein n=1 Tax=Aureobasidium melanogenum (strain CBS 110374) TaxID=1043003 RepID=A0A074W037_AURM1
MSSKNCDDSSAGVCHGGRPDLTLGLEDYVMILIPAACLLLMAPLRLRRTWGRSRKVVSPTALWWAKTMSSTSFVGLSLAVLIRGCVRPHAPSAEIPAEVFSFLASLTAAILSQWEHMRSIRPSALLQLYLMVALVVQAVHLRSIWLRDEDTIMRGLGIGQIVACAIFLAVESVSKESILLHRQKRSPQDTNDMFSQRLFWWLNNMFKRGYTSVLAPNDLDKMDEDLSSTDPQRRFRLEWRKHTTKNPKVNMLRIIFSAIGYDMMFPVIPRLLLLAIQFSQPYLILRFVDYIDNPDEGGTEEGILLVIATAIVYVAIATFQSWYWQAVVRFQTKLRGCLISQIHDKALRSRVDTDSNPLMLMNVDVEKTLVGIRPMHEFWACGVSIVIALGLLYSQVGLPFLAPLVLLVVFVAIASSNGKKIGPKTKLWLAATQERVSYITSVIGSMKNIKLLGIGPSVLDKGNKLREKEVRAQRAIRMAAMINLVISLVNSQAAALVMYGAFAIKTHLTGVPLTNSILFTSLAVLKLFTNPLLMTIQYLPSLLQVFAALARIQEYLVTEDHTDQRTIDSEAMAHGRNTKTGISVSETTELAQMRKLTCGYADGVEVLKDVELSLPRNKLNIVVGSVGSGKSTLLKALLGEVTVKSGSIVVADDEIAYCSQNPWLWNGSIRENIVGADPHDDVWLTKVSWACGLDQDFQELPDGIDTRVGNDGTALSGGQKNRISLARAIYSRRSLVLLDDVLSGLDTRTERLVFNRVLGPQGILRKMRSTVVLATHAIGWLRYADTILVLEDGKLVYQGAPGNAPASFIRQHAGIPEQDPEEDIDNTSPAEIPIKKSRSSSVSSSTAKTVSNWQLYKDYFRSFGTLGLTSFTLLIIGFSVLQCVQQLVLKWWAGAEVTSSSGLGKWVGILGAITVAFVVVVFLTLYVGFIYMFPRSSLYLHVKQFTALVKVRYSAWGGKETGSIANRFSQDISIIDMQLGNALLNVMAGTTDVIAMASIIIVATPFIAATLPVLALVFWVIQNIYLRTGKQLRIMDLEAKAPLCTHFLETVTGVATIKSFGWAKAYREKNEKLLEESQTPYYLLESVQNWLTLVLNLVVAGLATVTMAIVVKLRASRDAGYVALALINIMDIGPILEMLVVAWTQLETSMGAIARMKEFIESTPEEEQGKVNPPSDWMTEGSISITNLEASYSDTAPSTIKNINLQIKHGQKIAICGRTGSGKSSLASAVFGLLHISSGSLKIDGIDITTVSQELLRSKMIALPQDPYFTSGTVRENLSLRATDTKRSDAEMLASLSRVGLLSKFSTLAEAEGSTWQTALDVILNPDDMLTKGQTQLFAMARAILSSGSIVLVDEATSGLDHETEATVQKLLREEFGGKTVIAIAHHLQTIVDFDVVVVLDGGRIAEVGVPGELREKEGSLFGELLRAAT